MSLNYRKCGQKPGEIRMKEASVLCLHTQTRFVPVSVILLPVFIIVLTSVRRADNEYLTVKGIRLKGGIAAKIHVTVPDFYLPHTLFETSLMVIDLIDGQQHRC